MNLAVPSLAYVPSRSAKEQDFYQRGDGGNIAFIFF